MKVLFPTDYSENARNAFVYACELSKELNATLTLIHTYNAQAMSTDIDSVSKSKEQIHLQQLTRLEEFVKSFNTCEPKLPIEDINIQCVVAEGDSVYQICTYCEQNDINYIVMGTKGATNSEKAKYGTITSNTIINAKVPVFAIPSDVTFKAFKNIMIAEDFEQHDTKAIKQVKEIADFFQAHVYVLHVNEAKDLYSEKRKQNYSKIKFASRNYDNFTFEFCNHESSKFNSFETYIEEKNIDLVAMFVRPSIIAQHQFDHSLTNYMALAAEVPLLTFPKETQHSIPKTIAYKRNIPF